MSNPFPAEPKISSSRTAYTYTDYYYDDDDDDDAAADDDEDESSVVPRNERWFTDSGFGSPEWWSRH